ncbi:metallopeptidase TldD-related protein [Pseudonocardia sp. CA-107938]|uniref:metallopeptidase TldD-related protein n=1 Tax=Pseudonocardia sp. CA-107938 TaxID=3240021 RepID=UPI003D8BCC8B
MRPQEVVERTLAAATGLAGCVVLVRESSEVNLRWANSTMTTNGLATSASVTVVAMVDVDGGTAAGTVSSSAAVTDVVQLHDLVAAAELAARGAGPAEDAMPLVEAGAEDPTWEQPGAATTIGVFEKLAAGLPDAFAGQHRHYGFASHELMTVWLGTSTGVRRRWVQPTGSVELNVKTADMASSAWTGASTADFTDVDVTALAAEAARRLEWGARRVQLPPGRYETLLPPSAVADLMIYLAWSMGGRSAQEGQSALAGPNGPRVGERLTELPLTLFSDPAAAGMETEPFLTAGRSGEGVSVFDNGSPVRRVDWVDGGVIGELMYSRGEAARFGTTFTPAGDNLLLTGGSGASIDELVARTERGLLLTCLWYIRLVDPTTLLLTGLTRDGVYLVENGEVTAEVDHNFRFNYSPLDVLRRATEVGATERTLPREWKDWFTRAAMPPVRVPEFNMSSVSLGR